MKDITLAGTIDTGYKVQSTNNLSLFKQIDANRKHSSQHSKRIFHSMRDNRVLYSPLIVNDNLGIIDGQHRLDAMEMYQKRVNPQAYIDYIVFDKLNYGSKEIPLYNTNADNWKATDFVNAYVRRDNASALILQKLIDHVKGAGKSFSVSTCLVMLTGLPSQAALRSGKLEVTETEYNNAVEIFNMMLEFDKVGVPYWRQINFVKALRHFRMRDLYNESVLLRAISLPNLVNAFMKRVNMTGTKVKDYEDALDYLYKQVNIRFNG